MVSLHCYFVLNPQVAAKKCLVWGNSFILPGPQFPHLSNNRFEFSMIQALSVSFYPPYSLHLPMKFPFKPGLKFKFRK